MCQLTPATVPTGAVPGASWHIFTCLIKWGGDQKFERTICRTADISKFYHCEYENKKE